MAFDPVLVNVHVRQVNPADQIKARTDAQHHPVGAEETHPKGQAQKRPMVRTLEEAPEEVVIRVEHAGSTGRGFSKRTRALIPRIAAGHDVVAQTALSAVSPTGSRQGVALPVVRHLFIACWMLDVGCWMFWGFVGEKLSPLDMERRTSPVSGVRWMLSVVARPTFGC